MEISHKAKINVEKNLYKSDSEFRLICKKQVCKNIISEMTENELDSLFDPTLFISKTNNAELIATLSITI